MPEEEKKTVDLDTSGPGADIDIEEKKDETVIEQSEVKEEGTDKTYENERETKLEEKKEDDNKLEEYSKGVQARIGKLTRKLREAERREQAALDYAKGVEKSKIELESKFKKTDSDYIKKFETTISSGLEAAQKELAAAIESGNAQAQVEANKRIATLAFENAKLDAAKEGREATTQAEKPVQTLSQGGDVNIPQTDDPINMDPKAEAWASKNPWFGSDRAMTYTAFEIHKDLTEKEGFDPSSDEYYAEVDKRIKVDFPHKFGNTENKQSTAPVQTVWVPPSSLDAPPAPDGFRYRWIRAEVQGFQDTTNIQSRVREGYELVRAEEVENASDYPVIDNGKYKGVIGVGGLLLAKVPVEIAKQRQEYMTKRHEERSEAVENDLMREQDSRMPINVDRQSRVTFGGTKK